MFSLHFYNCCLAADDSYWYFTQEISGGGGDVTEEISGGGRHIQSRRGGLVMVPERGWVYRSGERWREDDSLTVTGDGPSY